MYVCTYTRKQESRQETKVIKCLNKYTLDIVKLGEKASENTRYFLCLFVKNDDL